MNQLSILSRTIRCFMIFLSVCGTASAGSLVWQNAKADAVSLANTEGKNILLIIGSGDSDHMRDTVCESISPRIRCLIEQNFVPWYSDYYTGTEHQTYLSGLGSFYLPVICVIDPNDSDNFLDRTTGSQDPNTFFARLQTIAGRDCATFTISGSVRDSAQTGIPGVMLRFSGNEGIAVTDGAGYYSHEIVSGWSGDVKPYKIGLEFTPAGRPYADCVSNLDNQDYGAETSDLAYILEIHPAGRVAGLLMPPSEFDIWNGTTSVEDRTKVSVFLYQNFRDDFDFLILMSNNDEVPGSNFGTSFGVRNDTEGIGKPIYDSTSAYGSSGRLRSIIHLPARGLLKNGPSLHEILHAWGNDLLQTDVSGHWGFSSAGGQLGGFARNTLVSLGNDVYQANNGISSSFGRNANGGNSLPYSEIELYLMGLADASAVSPILVFNNAAYTSYSEGIFTATGSAEYTIRDIVDQHGDRIPSVADSQKAFRTLTVLLSPTPITDPEWEEVDLQAEFLGHDGADTSSYYNFWEATQGMATMKMDEIGSSLVQSTGGDVNNDRTVDLTDAILALRVPVGLNDATIFRQADVNNDGKIGFEEAVYVLQILSGARSQ